MIYRQKGTVEAWQVPQEKDGRKKLPEWVADWFPGRVANERALVLLTINGKQHRVDPMAGDWVGFDRSTSTFEVLSAAEFDTRFEPAE